LARLIFLARTSDGLLQCGIFWFLFFKEDAPVAPAKAKRLQVQPLESTSVAQDEARLLADA
jgi:hypothetical protein